jgi:hypothetical protein
VLLEASRLRDRPLQKGSWEGRKVESLQIAGVFFDLVETKDKELVTCAEVPELQNTVETRFEGMQRRECGEVCRGERKILLALLRREVRESVEGVEFLFSQDTQPFLWPGGRRG